MQRMTAWEGKEDKWEDCDFFCTALVFDMLTIASFSVKIPVRCGPNPRPEYFNIESVDIPNPLGEKLVF